MLIIGLTGVSGSGKGYVSEYFKELGFFCVDSDSVVHRLYRECDECVSALAAAFGDGVVMPDGTVDRKALGKIVFSDSEKLKRLNGIVHGFTAKRIDAILAEREKAGDKAVIIDAPQLFEAALENRCDAVISVIADNETRIVRICKRDGITKEQALDRIRNQHDDAFFESRSDYIIINNGGDIKPCVNRILTELRLL